MSNVESYNWLTLAAIVIGPIAAVLISQQLEQSRRQRDQRMSILRVLLTTRHLVSDPAYSAAINLIPVEFDRCPKVIAAYRQFLDATRAAPTADNDEQVRTFTVARQISLIFEVATTLGYKIKETDLQTTAYVSEGWATRDNLNVDAQRATRDIAHILFAQTRIMSGSPLSAEELSYLGLKGIEKKPDA